VYQIQGVVPYQTEHDNKLGDEVVGELVAQFLVIVDIP
jgi:hypothetical protein